ncbi:type II/IV secretion system ATPase subunit [Candidatus Woesearchaeota archaeon]|nr:type II/IV secretion system ATPase subunit [Candidatus Woesearchaeota archaeon]
MTLFGKKEDDMYTLIRQGGEAILHINYESSPKIPSIEDDEFCMSEVVNELLKNPAASKIVFSQKHDYEYDESQTAIIKEIAELYNRLAKNKDMLSIQALTLQDLQDKYKELHEIVFTKLRKDPIGAYVHIKRILRRENILLDKAISEEEEIRTKKYIAILEYISQGLEDTKIVALIKNQLAGYDIGNRELYRKIFMPIIKPDFMFTKLMATYPKGGEEMASYMIGDTEVTVFKLKDSVQYMYHIMPPEFKLSEEKYELLDSARRILAEHKPKKKEFVDPERMREVFVHVGQDLLEELAEFKNLTLTGEEIRDLTQILIRYTVGFGLIEVLLADVEVQDITVNSPFGTTPIFLVHGKYGECKTNIIPSIADGESWASKLRLISGRPLDEANPILDTEILIPDVARARIGAIEEPLSPGGVAYAFRRHRDHPWTLPLFVKTKMLNTLAAGLLWFLIDGNRTFLIAGTRSAGKTSLLGSMMVEIMRKYRIITIEDTLELPGNYLRKLGYNIQQLKVASALSRGGSEVPADQGIRTTLRLGDSALIVGEVRSTEAKALYEAMRVGALANVVAGTIHGDSPYGVFDRVVNDLEVPRTSFKATDIIVVANPIRSADGLHKFRRVTSITEVRKKWEDDPLREGGFVELMKYNAKTDELEPTSDLLNGDSEILKAIAGSVREWAGNWDAVWDNINLRAKCKSFILETSKKFENPDMLEAEFVIQANDQFHRISDKVKDKKGMLDSKAIFFEWSEWVLQQARRFKQEQLKQ